MDLVVELLKSAFLGLVEGITEWLPVSSTGHMILVDEFIKLNVTEQFWNMFLVVIQLGAILAVIVMYFHDLNPFSPSKGAQGRAATWRLWGKVILGCVPAALIGLPLNDFMEEHLYNSYVVAAMLILYGVAFILIENWRAKKRSEAADLATTSGGAHFATPAAPQADAVPTKGLEVVLAHKARKPVDGSQGHDEGNDEAHAHEGPRVGDHGVAGKHELHNLEQARTEHDGDCQEEREARGHRARRAEKQAADDGGAGTRGAGTKRKHLEATDT